MNTPYSNEVIARLPALHQEELPPGLEAACRDVNDDTIGVKLAEAYVTYAAFRKIVDRRGRSAQDEALATEKYNRVRAALLILDLLKPNPGGSWMDEFGAAYDRVIAREAPSAIDPDVTLDPRSVVGLVPDLLPDGLSTEAQTPEDPHIKWYGRLGAVKHPDEV